MEHFDHIYQRACERHGGEPALGKLMPVVRSPRRWPRGGGGGGDSIARTTNRRWPAQELIDLFTLLKNRGSRLGGMTGQRVLRNMGKDTFIVTADVVRCLQRSGLDIGDNPSSKREMQLIQGAFNLWHEDSALPFSHISRICAMSL
ncbi:MAG: hypothetical protein IPG64_04840 [Haliea sp.]|nr:hypothetical protein [Haliea sp.]